jgi:hypothetical protein
MSPRQFHVCLGRREHFGLANGRWALYYVSIDERRYFFLRTLALGAGMIDAIIAWDMEDDPKGNVQHIAANGVTMEEVEEMILNERNAVGTSRSSGRPMTFGTTSAGKQIAVVWE